MEIMTKKLLTLFLAFAMMLFTGFAPGSENASAAASAAAPGNVVFQSGLGHQVVEVAKNGTIGYIIVSSAIDTQDGNTRNYLAFAENLQQAKRIANAPVQTSGVVAPEASYFWHNSYVERTWHLTRGSGTHLYLSPVDTGYITNLGWVAADTLCGALVVAGVITGGAAVVIGGIATIAVLTLSWSMQNDDGSLDIYAYDKYIKPASCAYGGQYLGYALSGTGNWYDYYWPSYAPSYCY